METKKRSRAVNFESAEVQLLVKLVDKYKEIVENKKTDTVTNKNKYAVWKKIEISFNSCGVSSNFRTWKTLKIKYEGMKKVSRKKSSLQRQEMSKTSSGPSDDPDFNDIEGKVFIGSNITGLEAHDSDTIWIPTPNDENISLDKLSAAQFELVQLQMETARKQHQFKEDEHKIKMLHLANDEARKQELHKLLVKKIQNNGSGPVLNVFV